jgi:hypothetical protein
MLVRPLDVTITTKDTTLLAEKRYDVECVSGGSRPTATISWWKNSRQILKPPITVILDYFGSSFNFVSAFVCFI